MYWKAYTRLSTSPTDMRCWVMVYSEGVVYTHYADLQTRVDLHHPRFFIAEL